MLSSSKPNRKDKSWGSKPCGKQAWTSEHVKISCPSNPTRHVFCILNQQLQWNLQEMTSRKLRKWRQPAAFNKSRLHGTTHWHLVLCFCGCWLAFHLGRWSEQTRKVHLWTSLNILNRSHQLARSRSRNRTERRAEKRLRPLSCFCGSLLSSNNSLDELHLHREWVASAEHIRYPYEIAS